MSQQQYYTQTQTLTHRTRSHTRRSYSKSLVVGYNDKPWKATSNTVTFPVPKSDAHRREPFNNPSVIGRRSKGVAIVHFQRIGDAVEARRMFNGKIIDGRRPLKIELIVDPPAGVFPPIVKKEKTKTLAERLSIAPSEKSTSTPWEEEISISPPLRPSIKPRRLTARLARSHRRTIPRGPRRTRKSLVELDLEMESYMAARKPTVILAAH
ncbi:hypothetical protein Clacol_009334 [Clathrus columnatus]|uniref:RRM domain-containing protein n=1 Tax=Clathrus columnatus TaxID=1419009 RepID=A0AAV5AKB2_9AGAM|nr:hypothetical protein Clacol_009334 [Clathrus columnatus]